MSKTNPARGMRDFLPADVRKREYVIGIIKQVYESYGFEPLETPAVENIETLMGKYGEEGNQLVFKILKRGEKLTGEFAKFSELAESENSPNSTNSVNSLTDLALRYDLTVPLARVVADRRNELPKFFKRYQIQPVWRADRPARGRFREFYQCDVDAIGSGSMIIEAEMMSAVSEIFSRLGRPTEAANFDDFVILVNHRDVLFGFGEAFKIADDKLNDALVVIDKADKIGPGAVMNELVNKGILSEEDAGIMVMELFSSVGEVRETSDTRSPVEKLEDENHEELNRLEGIIGQTERGRAGLKAIREFLALSKGLQSHGHIRIQSSLARGLSYYTGAIFEVGLNRLDFKGSIGGGGRYDGLIGMFGKEQIPACGFSLGLERILVVMDERGMFPPEIAESAPADVMVTLWSEETAAESLKLASELRSAGLRVTVYPEADKFGKQMKYADAVHVPFVAVLGESEIAEGKVTVKNMKTGDQVTVARGEAADQIH
jgi:histidyl-tRNA synthetase